MSSISGVAAADQRWSEMLALWAIPDHILAGAEESPYFFDQSVFAAAADEALTRAQDSPSDRRARSALPAGGSVIDVGCGGGAASLRLRPARLTGVDSSPAMLGLFEERGRGLGLAASIVEGAWPDVADVVPVADVVVCHHVVYNAARLGTFARALDEHARVRTVVELTAVHPMTWMAPYWQALHGLRLPDCPTADDAIELLEGMGWQIGRERWTRPYQMLGETGADGLERIARRLCLPRSRRSELGTLLEETPPPPQREMVTLWW
ncbi:MAG TPA: class I SAM-dependent methyltransferase [Acidimicrobiales bacterium]|nr:class I SAM-dependent methyltransferase [Acidimicrobiales bacterium]